MFESSAWSQRRFICHVCVCTESVRVCAGACASSWYIVGIPSFNSDIAAMADLEPSKKKRRFWREPDLEALVEDEVFHVHSHDLMSVSDVFATMLENDMRENEETRIVLAGKTKEEFRTLQKRSSSNASTGRLPSQAAHRCVG